MQPVVAPNWRKWFWEVWPSRSRVVISQALTIGRQHKEFLTDLALRGNVYAPIMVTDPIAAAREEGRRQLALETIKLCGADAQALFALVEPKPKEGQS